MSSGKLTMLPDDEEKMPGVALLNAIISKSHEKGHNITELAKELGISVGYLAMLFQGKKSSQKFNEVAFKKVAKYLGASVNDCKNWLVSSKMAKQTRKMRHQTIQKTQQVTHLVWTRRNLSRS